MKRSAVVAASVTGRGYLLNSEQRTALAVGKPLRIRSPTRSTRSHRTGLGHAASAHVELMSAMP